MQSRKMIKNLCSFIARYLNRQDIAAIITLIIGVAIAVFLVWLVLISSWDPQPIAGDTVDALNPNWYYYMIFVIIIIISMIVGILKTFGDKIEDEGEEGISK